MTSENLQRTTYRDPKQPLEPVRQGNATWQENDQDMDQYYLPLERIHGSSLHGWGVANGLEVTATLNNSNPNLTVSPGVALDSRGHHISLAESERAEIGQNPTGFSNGATFKPVTATGVVIPTAKMEGDKYLTIAFLETFDDDGYNTQGDFRYFHTPWLQLLDVTGFSNDGTRIVLAKVSFGTKAQAGQIIAPLSPELRQGTDLPLGSIHLQKSFLSANGTIGSVEAGVIRASATGGIAITVPSTSDEIHLERDDGDNFHKVSLGADAIVARRSDGRESVVIDTPKGNITTSGNISASNVIATGNMTAESITSNGDIKANGNIIAASGDITATGSITSKNSIGTSGYIIAGNGIFSGANKNETAGDFKGRVVIDGTLTKPGGSFRIDHPLDPAKKYLSHSFVESPDMKNIYDEVATCDTNGEAVVELPVWFEVLNSDLRYQLTCIGDYAPVYIAEKVKSNRFKIAGGKPGLEVSWQVTGTRQDAWAKANRIAVEEEKPLAEQGYYIHPELFGASEEKYIRVVQSPTEGNDEKPQV